MPKTKLGKWAVGLMAAFFLFLLSVMLFSRLGQRAGHSIFDNLYLGIPGICMAISGPAAFFTGAISLFKLRDRSFLVMLTTIIGFIVTLIVVGEVIEGLTYLH
jgi:hypothetical protein